MIGPVRRTIKKFLSRPSRHVLWRAGLSAFLWSLVATPGFAQPATRMQFDCAANHTFSGFGLNIGALPGRTAPLLELLDELHVKFVRWKAPPDTDNADVPEGVSLPELIDWLEQQIPRQPPWFGPPALRLFASLQQRDIASLPAIWYPPAKWRAARPNPLNPLREDRVEDDARLSAAAVAVLRRHGIKPYAIELHTEPYGKVTVAEYAAIVQRFRVWERQAGIPLTPIAGPATVYTIGNRPYLETLARQGVRLDITATHAYDSFLNHQLATMAPLLAALPAGRRTPLFVTEYGIDASKWFGSWSAVEGIPHAVLLAGQTLALLGSSADAVVYWQAQDPPWAKESWGLLDKQDRRRPAIDALRTIVQPLAVGDRIVLSGQQPAGVPIVLVSRPSQLLLEIANPNTTAADYRIDLQHCGAGPVTVERSTAWPAGRAVAARATTPESLDVALPAETVAVIAARRQ